MPIYISGTTLEKSAFLFVLAGLSVNMTPLKFNVFGRIVLVEKQSDGWQAYYAGIEGKKRQADFIIPGFIIEADLGQYLGDLFHENASPSNADVKRI